MKIKKHQIYINGLKIVYFIAGKGKPILFLHGGRIKAFTYKKNLELLAQKYMVIAPDIPYFGESDSPKKIWEYEDYNTFFTAFIKALQLKDITVIGHSMGGGLAFHFASDSPLVSHLILVNANGVDYSGKNSLAVEMERILFYATSPQYWATFFILVRDGVFHHTRHFWELNKHDTIRRNYTGSEQILGKIKIPTLLLWSTHDSIFPLSIARIFHKWIKNSTVEIVDGTHDWILYNPELFYKRVEEFLQ